MWIFNNIIIIAGMFFFYVHLYYTFDTKLAAEAEYAHLKVVLFWQLEMALKSAKIFKVLILVSMN